MPKKPPIFKTTGITLPFGWFERRERSGFRWEEIAMMGIEAAENINGLQKIQKGAGNVKVLPKHSRNAKSVSISAKGEKV